MHPMTSNSSQSAAALQRRLQLLVSVALRHSVAALDGFTRRLGSVLTEASLQERDAMVAAVLQQAAEHLSRERASFQRLFSDCLQHALEREVKILFARPKSRLRRGALDLSLDSFEAMQRKVEVDNLAQAFDRTHAEALETVRQAIAGWLGHERPAQRNPFRAEVFLNAAMTAWERFEPRGETRAVLLRQLAPGAFIPLDGILAAVCQELAGSAREGDGKRGARPAPALLEAERRVLAQPGRVFDDAVAHLAQARMLPPHTMQVLVGMRPLLRALAESDGRFLLSARHPGRRFAHLAIQASLAGGPDVRAVAALRNVTERTAARFGRQSGFEALEEGCSALDAQLARLLQSVADKRDECIAEAARQEREARAEQLARSEVMARLEPGAVPAFVEAFLLEHWVRVLAFAQTVHATKPALLPNLVQAMDELIWSVQDKPGSIEREELQARLPALLSLINAWLNVVKWEGPARIAFMERLAQRHAMLLHAQAGPDARARLEAHMDTVERASEQGLRELEDAQQEEALLPYMHRIDALAPGDWAEFVRNDGSAVQCRLSWVSPARSRFVFVAPSAQMAFLITEDLFAQGLRAGRVRLTATGELLQEAIARASAAI